MTDDIVTRLRDLREMLMGNPIMAREVQEAMDEIERLRELADNFYRTLLYYPCQCRISPCKCGYDDMMDEYKEVRGE